MTVLGECAQPEDALSARDGWPHVAAVQSVGDGVLRHRCDITVIDRDPHCDERAVSQATAARREVPDGSTYDALLDFVPVSLDASTSRIAGSMAFDDGATRNALVISCPTSPYVSALQPNATSSSTSGVMNRPVMPHRSSSSYGPRPSSRSRPR
ncbi:MAG: hypothetical protein IPM29_05960 [Planctomycetes bacterium]|nr:hypothetical protein [Planctomycetota bacterium]